MLFQQCNNNMRTMKISEKLTFTSVRDQNDVQKSIYHCDGVHGPACLHSSNCLHSLEVPLLQTYAEVASGASKRVNRLEVC